MRTLTLFGYAGQILRVNLTTGEIDAEPLPVDALRRDVGGPGLGAKYLLREVPAGVEWDDPRNRLMFFTGPLAGTKVHGGTTLTVNTRGPMTNLAASTQANGLMAAFLRQNGFEGIIFEGIAARPTYLEIRNGQVALRDASALMGKDTWETEDLLKETIPGPSSVLCIGPAGERLVRWAAICGDHGHVAAHNGVGAVMGRKNLKAIIVQRGKRQIPIADPEGIKRLAPALFEDAKASGGGARARWGTGAVYGDMYRVGMLPIRNLTTNLWDHVPSFTGEAIRTRFEWKPKACWSCSMHCASMVVTDGPYQGFGGEEPEYEGIAFGSSIIDQTDPGAMVYLANLVDRLGLDINEAGWVIGWAMECYEKGYLTRDALDGLDMTWGTVSGTEALLRKIAAREGIGDLLAEGVKRAAERVGGDAKACAVYTEKGASPRGHDHRARWDELLDTCLGNTGTIEATGGSMNMEQLGFPPVRDRFSPLEVATANARINGRRIFEDAVGVCRFCSEHFPLLIECVNAITGWDMDVPEALAVGKRAVARLRAFNFRHGLRPEAERPSARYGSTPVDGPARGIAIGPVFESMRDTYWTELGWTPGEGRPLPETLRRLGLDDLIPELWPGGSA